MRIISLIALLALAGCGKDDDVQTVVKDMKTCRDGGGKPSLASLPFYGMHIVCWPKEAFN